MTWYGSVLLSSLVTPPGGGGGWGGSPCNVNILIQFSLLYIALVVQWLGYWKLHLRVQYSKHFITKSFHMSRSDDEIFQKDLPAEQCCQLLDDFFSQLGGKNWLLRKNFGPQKFFLPEGILPLETKLSLSISARRVYQFMDLPVIREKNRKTNFPVV